MYRNRTPLRAQAHRGLANARPHADGFWRTLVCTWRDASPVQRAAGLLVMALVTTPAWGLFVPADADNVANGTARVGPALDRDASRIDRIVDAAVHSTGTR